MNDNNLFEKAFDAIDDEFLAEAKHPGIRIAARRKKILIGSIAACIAAILVTVPSIKIISDLNNNQFTNSIDTEIIYQEEIIQQGGGQGQTVIVGGGGSTGGGGSHGNSIGSVDYALKGNEITVNDLCILKDSTKQFSFCYAPDIKYLYIDPVSTDATINIYKRQYQESLSIGDAHSLADKFFPKIASALNAPIPPKPYKIETNSNRTHISIEYPEDYWQYRFNVYDYLSLDYIAFSTATSSIQLGDQSLSINNLKTDEEFINKLSGAKQKLSDLFEVQFNDIKVVSEYNDDENTSEPFFITVYFYNKSAHPLNSQKTGKPFSDYICIEYVNASPNKETGESNEGVYYLIDVIYQTNQTELICIGQEELLSVEKAAEYLTKGYVLQYEKYCSLCTAQKNPSAYIGYDYVSMEYIGGYDDGDLTLPYYVFYKNTGTTKNGKMIFSKSYVPVIEVTGYEEYFENKHAQH